ncbi:hypothetical protein [Pseudoxanthomonas suwonensis]
MSGVRICRGGAGGRRHVVAGVACVTSVGVARRVRVMRFVPGMPVVRGARGVLVMRVFRGMARMRIMHVVRCMRIVTRVRRLGRTRIRCAFRSRMADMRVVCMRLLRQRSRRRERQRDAQRERVGGAAHARSSTRTSRIIPPSMW